LIGCDIALYRQQLPELEAGDYYWSDLIGLRVLNLDGVDLGQVERLIETGANDVLVLQGERERLIPYLKDQVIKQINLDDKVIQVDWDPEF
jgi:16S rRNA processing protein RimM